MLDLSTVVAGPNCARYLADFGADVIKVERPDGGDSVRTMGWNHPDGTGLWHKLINRNKRMIALDLKEPDDLAVLWRLVDGADVLIENFRPGTLERLGLGPDVLLARRPQLVITRVTGFGQTGPYASRPGFATIAEGMSGFAGLNGEADGPPLLPPIALTDEITGLAAAFATMVALRSGIGQVVDVSLIDTMLQVLAPLPSLWAANGELQPRMGSALPYSVPRGTYRCADDRYVAISASSNSVARRLMQLLGVGDDERFSTFAGRIAHRDEVERLLVEWCAARTSTDVVATFTAAHVAVGPVLTMDEVLADPHVVAREVMVEVEAMPMPGPIARRGREPGEVRTAGRPLDADGADIREHGWSPGA